MCKAICVKITYTVVIALIFFFPTFYCYDAYSTLKHVTTRAFEDRIVDQKTQDNYAYRAEIRSDMMNIRLGNGIYDDKNKCFYIGDFNELQRNNFNYSAYTKPKSGEYFTVDYYDNCGWHTINVTCLDSIAKKFYWNFEGQYITNLSGFGFCIVAQIAIAAFVVICCVDWRRCCCQKSRSYQQINTNQYY